MRAKQGWAAGVSVGVLLMASWLALGQTRSLVSSTIPVTPTVDAVVEAARVEAAREPIADKFIPTFDWSTDSSPGNYWMLQTDTPPLPFNPFPELTVYPLSDAGFGNVFLVDDRGVDYPGLQAQQAQLQAEAAALRSLEGSLGLMAMDSGPPGPPGGGGGGGTNDPPTFDPPVWQTSTQLCLIPPSSFVSNTLTITITNGVPGAPHDLYCTTNLSPDAVGLNLTNWLWLARSAPGQSNFVILDPPWPEAYYVLGTTNDSDHGGFPDAYEHLVTHGSVANANDDVFPLISIVATDSAADEQGGAGNPAQFLVSRAGGATNHALAVGLSLSGTASYIADYTLATLTTNPYPMGRAVIIPVGETSVEVTLTAIADSTVEGSETATLTVATNWPFYHVDAAHGSATAWIVEGYTVTYTTVDDFKKGTMAGLESVLGTNNGQLQFRTNLPVQFPFINVACSGRGTVARINTTNGQVVGEYRTAPDGLTFTGADGSGPQPSRTTVDQYGNVWVANRDDTRAINGTNYGSITRIGLILGTRYTKTNNSYVADEHGQYVGVTNALYNTCIDRDGDGYIRTSRGLADILPWSNPGGVDSAGGVSSAEDEGITEYTRVPSTGTRTLAVDRWNDLWVGGHTGHKTHLKVNGLLALPVPNSAFDPYDAATDSYVGGYGGVIDRLGNLWSAEVGGEALLWLRPSTNYPPQPGADWQLRMAAGASTMYGIAVDPLHPYIWQTAGGNVFRWHTNGTPVTNANGEVILYPHGREKSQGLAVDSCGHVWVAHQKADDHYQSHTVGHLDTNGVWLGNVELQVNGLWAEYFANTNLAGGPVLTNVEGPVDFSWTNGWPASELPANTVPTNAFSARWSGVVQPQAQGAHVFYVRAEAGGAFRLRVNGAIIIDNWTNPAAGAVELAGTNWLGTNLAYDLRLEYVHFTNGAAVALSWLEPGGAKEVIPLERFTKLSAGATGISVDAAGKIWAGCFDSDTVVRIDPNAGPLAVSGGVTNHVGLVDLVADLGDGTANDPHLPPYDVAAAPYNYSDMTGFNVRVVNPGGQPLKGYWTVIHDSGVTNEWWQRVTWTAFLTNGCGMEVQVRAANDRAALANQAFTVAGNDAPLTGVKGRFIEVRVALTRPDASQWPVLYDLTLHGMSSGFEGDMIMDVLWEPFETEDAWFFTGVTGAEPVTFQWYVMPPWSNQWALVSGVTGPDLVLTNVDLWDDGTWVSLSVSNATGETLWLGPSKLHVWAKPINIPTFGAASRYPATIHVRGQSNNFSRVEVTLNELTHDYPADLDILLVSPAGTKIMLMSDAGGSTTVSNATLVFHPASQWPGWPHPPETGPILSDQTSHYSPYNYGIPVEVQLPGGAPAGPYDGTLDDLPATDSNPNDIWQLYIYDDKAGQAGEVHSSWRLEFFYE